MKNESLNDKIKRMLIIAHSMGYEAGHHDTVEGTFYGNGRSEVHDCISKEIVEEATWDGSFERDLLL